MGIVSGITNLVISPKWGSCSEVSFTAYEKYNGVKNASYELLCKSRLLHIDGFGYFAIQDYEEAYEDKVHNKSITAYSAEYLLNNKSVNLTFITTAGDINNTDSTTTVTSNYFFYREEQPEKSLLHQLIAVAPQWKIGYISDSLKNKSRSFSETDNGLYGFLTNDVAQSYEALFVFDNEEYTINAYDTSEVIKPTNIVLSFDNLLKNATITEMSDDIYTVLNVTGAEDLSIQKVNPNGTKKLYCLDYYTGILDKSADNYYENYNSWIKDNALKKKILDWEKKCKEAIHDTSEGSYAYWTELHKKFNASLINEQAKLKEMQTYCDIAKQNMSAYSDYSDIYSEYVTIQRVTILGNVKTKTVTYQKWVDVYSHSKKDWEIVDYGNINAMRVPNTNVTWYSYWKNYVKGLEYNIKAEEKPHTLNGHPINVIFHSFNKTDFELGEDGSYPINKEYSRSSIFGDIFSSPKGDVYSTVVKNHNITPESPAIKYTILALKDELKLIQNERDKIVSQFSFENNFTEEEKLAIEPYLIEGTFSDETFIVTDSMKIKDYSDTSTKVQVIDADGNISIKTIGELKETDTIMDDIYVAEQLVDAGYEKFETVSQPSFSFSLESANFLFIEKFQPFIDQLLSLEKNKGSLFGAVINVELSDGNWVYPYLQEMEIQYDDPDSFTMSFGNRFRLSTEVYTFSELHNETTSAVSNVSSLLSSVSQPVTNGTIDAISAYANTNLNLTKQTIVATDENDFTIGSYGIMGKKKSTAENNVDGFDPEQLWITNNKICFTADGWETTESVFGKITNEDGSTTYGLIADTLIGNLIIGKNLIIQNNGETMTVGEDGLTVKNDNTGVSIDPNAESVFNIYKRKVIESTDEEDEDQLEEKSSVLTVDENGNLTIYGGKIEVGDGTKGYIIDGENGTITSIAHTTTTSGDSVPLFQLTPDGYLFTSGTNIDGEETIYPSPVVTPTGSDGIVNRQDITMPSGLMDRLRIIARAEYYGPYNYILDQIGQNDDEGWRKIWGYYSSRDIDQILVDFKNKGHTLAEINTSSLINYKTWNDTQSYINTQFGINSSDRFKKQQITINGVSYTVLITA